VGPEENGEGTHRGSPRTLPPAGDVRFAGCHVARPVEVRVAGQRERHSGDCGRGLWEEMGWAVSTKCIRCESKIRVAVFLCQL
jgi:hypothetical protein